MDKFCTQMMNKKGFNTKHVMNNFKFYTKKLCDFEEKTDLTEQLESLPGFVKINLNIPDKFSSSTPSVIYKDDEIFVNIRFVEYHIDYNGSYIFKDEENNCETINVLVQIKDNIIIDMNILDYETKYGTSLWGREFKGLEDIRLLEYDNRIYYSSTRPFTHPEFPNKKIGIQSGEIKNNMLETNIMRIENQRNFEKNWVICCKEEKLFYIYEWFPLTICQIDKVSNDVTDLKIIHKNSQLPELFKFLRGSTNGVVIDGEYWFICHLVHETNLRYYYHVFVVLDLDFNFIKMSSMFTFENKHIEYCLGLQFRDDKFLLGYSTMDRTSRFIQVDKSEINELF